MKLKRIFPALLILFVCAVLLWVGIFCGNRPEIRSDSTTYQKAHYIDTYGGDLDSNLSVFPDAIDNHMQVLEFASRLTTGLFDTDGYILLDYYLPDVAFEAELARLQGLTQTIHGPNGESHTNVVRYDETMYPFPAYITIDGFDNTYEYALIDHDAKRIICVYLACPNGAKFPYAHYLKSDPSAYERNSASNAFSMYNHSFDAGRSYTEFDD